MFLVPVPFLATRISTLSYVTHTIDTTYPQTLMASINPGDLLVFIEITADNGGTPVAAAYPSGWTAIGTTFLDSTNVIRYNASYKVASGSEDSANITGSSEDAFWTGIALQYRANKAITSLSASTPVAGIVGGATGTQTIAAASGVAPVLGIANLFTYDSNISGETISITPNHNITVNPSDTWSLYDYIQNSGPVNWTFGMPDQGSPENGYFGFYLHNFQ